MGSKYNELKKYQKKLDKTAKSISGGVKFSELFTKEFMRKYTNFDSFDNLLIYCGYEVETTEDFEAIPEEEFDSKLKTCTKFTSWDEMFSKASEEYLIKNLKM